MTPETMRRLAANWAAHGDLHARESWLQCAEICERQDSIIERLDRLAAKLAERERSDGE